MKLRARLLRLRKLGKKWDFRNFPKEKSATNLFTSIILKIVARSTEDSEEKGDCS